MKTKQLFTTVEAFDTRKKASASVEAAVHACLGVGCGTVEPQSVLAAGCGRCNVKTSLAHAHQCYGVGILTLHVAGAILVDVIGFPNVSQRDVVGRFL